jgi:hypothetical protein
MVAWAGMIPIFIWLTLFSFKEDILPMPVSTTPFWDRAFAKAWVWALSFELLIILAIVWRFWSRWVPMFHTLGWL